MALLPPNRNVRIDGIEIFLQPLDVTEINDVYLGWINDDEVNQYISTRRSRQTSQDIVDYVNNLRSNPPGDVFGIFKKDGRHLGNMSVTDYDPHNGLAGYGIMVGVRTARLSGLGGEASALMIEYLFSDPVVRRLQGGAMSDNTGAWRLMEALGYQREGVLREHSLTRDGVVCDWYLYGLLRREWKANVRVRRIVNRYQVTELS